MNTRYFFRFSMSLLAIGAMLLPSAVPLAAQTARQPSPDHVLAAMVKNMREINTADTAVCERQKNGACGWTATKAYDACIEEDYPHGFILVSNAEEKKDMIFLTNMTMMPNEVVPSKFEVEGKARGTWFFEASFPVRLVDEKGRLLARHYAQARGEWMTSEFVEFQTELAFDPPTTTDRGYILLEKDNPSGMPKFGDVLVFPVRFR